MMRPIDYSIATFRQISDQLVGLRASVYDALMEAGPSTTRQLAQVSGIDLLTVRPRITELLQLGLVTCLEEDGREGRYQALTIAQAQDLFHERVDQARNPQLILSL
ncbi:MAG TPA: hypothetical protein VGE39_00495 [Prosthecobacter sp.]